MVSAEDEFERQLEIFHSECDEAVRFFYAGHAVIAASFALPGATAGLNKAPVFWNSAISGLRTAAVVALGRMFDPNQANYSVARLLAFAHANLDIFSEAAVRRRMRRGDQPSGSVYVATGDDIRRLRSLVSARRREYEAVIRPWRHERYAHRSVLNPNEFKTGSAEVDAVRVQKLVAFFPRLHGVLWRLYFDGQKPSFRPARYSTDRMLMQPGVAPSDWSLQERVVQEAKYVLGLCVRDARRQ